MGRMPHGTSARSLNHYGQIVKNKRFHYYDYGKKINKEKYGTEEVPDIPLEKIFDSNVPMAFFVGEKDTVVPLKGSRWLYEFFASRGEIKNPVIHYQEMNGEHMSFVMGKNMTYFEKVLELVNDINSSKDPQAIKKKAERIIQQQEKRVQKKVDKLSKEEKEIVLEQSDKWKELEMKQKLES